MFGLITFEFGIFGLAKVGTIGSVILLMVIYYFSALGVVSAIISLSIPKTTGVESQRHDPQQVFLPQPNRQGQLSR